MPKPRMANPAMTVANVLPTLLALGESIKAVGLDDELRELIHMRASQINECSVCVDLAGTGLTQLGISSEKIYAISAWWQSQHFSDEERVVLKATEEVTRLTDGAGGLSDATFNDLAAHFDEPQIAAIVLNISLINFWNRVNDSTHQIPGSW